jgi:hypothetical protein
MKPTVVESLLGLSSAVHYVGGQLTQTDAASGGDRRPHGRGDRGRRREDDALARFGATIVASTETEA